MVFLRKDGLLKKKWIFNGSDQTFVSICAHKRNKIPRKALNLPNTVGSFMSYMDWRYLSRLNWQIRKFIEVNYSRRGKQSFSCSRGSDLTSEEDGLITTIWWEITKLFVKWQRCVSNFYSKNYWKWKMASTKKLRRNLSWIRLKLN